MFLERKVSWGEVVHGEGDRKHRGHATVQACEARVSSLVGPLFSL